MYCNKCGKQIDTGKPFCSFCGAPVLGHPEHANKADKKVMHFFRTFIPGFRTLKAWKIVIACFYYFIALILIWLTGWFGVFFLSIPFVILYVISFFINLGKGSTPRIISTIFVLVFGITSFIVFVATIPKPNSASTILKTTQSPIQKTVITTQSVEPDVTKVAVSVIEKSQQQNTSQSSSTPSPTLKPTPTPEPTPTPVVITNVDYIDFYNNYSNNDNGKWIRIVGEIYNLNSNSLSIEEGLPTGLTTELYIQINKEKVATINGLNEGDFIIVVGRVDGKVAGTISLDDCYVESTGQVALDAYKKQAQARIDNKVKEAIAITAPQLIQKYSDNEVKADNDYKDKLLVVTGTIDSIGKDFLDYVYVTLSDGSEFSFTTVHCTFMDQGQIELVAKLQKGTKITILGTCKGESLTSPMLDDCYIVSN